jgi:hypothetical protein
MAKNKDLKSALPQSLELPPDELQVRLDFFKDSVMLTSVDGQTRTTRMVSANDVALAMLREIPLSSGILPDGALWWAQGGRGPEVAIWRKPQVWKVALQEDLSRPAHRFALPMPGLVFVCRPAEPPRIYAAKERPKAKATKLYHAPLTNVYQDGFVCQGSHSFPRKVEDIPESFFTSFFSHAGMANGRSKKYPNNLMDLWREIDGKKRFPTNDLVYICTVREAMDYKGRR